METIGLQDMPAEAINAMRHAPRLLRAVTSIMRGKEGRVHLRIDGISIDREDMATLATCPLFAHALPTSPIVLVFDPDQDAIAVRRLRRQQVMSQLSEVAPEVAPSEPAMPPAVSSRVALEPRQD